MKKGKKRIVWHPAFCAAAEFDLRENKADLIFEQEHLLNKEPIRMDLLIIKKKDDAVIKNVIGHFFTRHNIIEYKSPDDGMNINDYLKTVAYACLYKSLGKTKEAISVKDITISLFREAYPRTLMEDLKGMGILATKVTSGIYVLDGNIMFPAQIVVTKELDQKTSPGMCMLSKNLKLSVLENFYQEAIKAKDPKDKENIDAILHASGCANNELFQQAMEVTTMSDFLLELMKDEIEKREAKSIERGIVQGQDNCAELMGILLKAGRIDDALKATADKAYLDSLIEELVIKQ